MPYGVLNVINSGRESEFEWKLENFSFYKYGYGYKSPIFKFEGQSWWLEVFPYWRQGYMCLVLSRETFNFPMEVEFSVSIKTVEGGKRFERRERFEGRISSYEIKEWIHTSSELRDHAAEFLSNGCLTILLTMKMRETQTATSASKSSRVSNHDKVLKQLLLNQEHSDVILRVKGKEFPAHKNILAIQSPVFASTFRHEMKENITGIVDIEDCDPSVFTDFLSFLYCNDLDNLSGENVFDLFTMADKYDCPDLRTMCVNFIKENLTVEIFCKALTLALLHSEAELLHVATDFFIKYVDKILVTVDWQTFAAENPTCSNELFIKFVNSTKCSNS